MHNVKLLQATHTVFSGKVQPGSKCRGQSLADYDLVILVLN